jgi:hypothetical protein
VKRVAAFLIAVVADCGCETAISSDVPAGPSPVKCQVALAAPSMIDARGGSGSLGVTTQPECGWEASTSVNWISALAPSSGQGTSEVSFRVAANDGGSTRDGMIVVNGEQVRVSQRAACRYDVSPSSQSVSVSGGAGTVRISTTEDCAWRATSDAGWIALNSTVEGSGNGTVSYTVARNQGQARSASIVVADQRATIRQAGEEAPSPAPPPPTPPTPAPPTPAPPTPPPPSPPACSYSISPGSQKADPEGGAGMVAVSTSSTCKWTASSNDSWIVVTSGASGAGNGTVSFKYSANTGNKGRDGTLTVAGRTATIEQKESKGKGKD